MAFLDLEWLNNNADAFACTTCGRIEWFTEATISEGGASDRDCPRCGYFIPAAQAFCPNCKGQS
jgi:RNA polymerase subunit RPABC4/transcription elongation factor Spt4